MYPYKVYCSKPGESRYTLYPVWVNGYALSISASAFKQRTLTAGYKASKKHKTLKAYDHLPSFRYDYQVQEDLEFHEEMLEKYPDRPFLWKLQNKEYDLLDFYKEIGYDKATGKINGRTLAQHIKYYMEKQS
jgi:hypothetical protein